MNSNESSRSERPPFHFFDDLIRRGKLSKLRDAFTTPRRKGQKYFVHYDRESDSRIESRFHEGWQEWKESSKSYTDYLFGHLKPEFDRVVACLDEDYRCKDGQEEKREIGLHYLDRIARLEKSLSKYEEEEGRELVRRCLNRIVDEIYHRGPESLPPRNIIDKYPTLENLPESSFSFAKCHVRWVQKNWPDEIPHGQKGNVLDDLQTRFDEEFEEVERPSGDTVKRMVGDRTD